MSPKGTGQQGDGKLAWEAFSCPPGPLYLYPKTLHSPSGWPRDQTKLVFATDIPQVILGQLGRIHCGLFDLGRTSPQEVR